MVSRFVKCTLHSCVWYVTHTYYLQCIRELGETIFLSKYLISVYMLYLNVVPHYLFIWSIGKRLPEAKTTFLSYRTQQVIIKAPFFCKVTQLIDHICTNTWLRYHTATTVCPWWIINIIGPTSRQLEELNNVTTSQGISKIEVILWTFNRSKSVSYTLSKYVKTYLILTRILHGCK